MRRFLLALIPLLLFGCGNLPRPFQHEGDEQPLAQPQAARPIAVTAPADLPGLAAAMVAALGKEDIAASLTAGGDYFLQLDGQIVAAHRLVWRLTDSKGKGLGETVQDLPASGDFAAASERAAQSIARLLRSDELGGRDLAARPRVTIDKVVVQGSLDAELLKRALIMALEQHGVAVVTEQAQLHVSGLLRISQGLAGHDLVEVTWTAVDDQGKEIGKVNQGSPVMRDDLLAKANQMTHQIAEGGAQGIKQLLQAKR